MKSLSKIFVNERTQRRKLIVIFLLFVNLIVNAQNSMVTNGFGGRLWYKSYNYTVGSYSAFTVCGAEKQLWAWGHGSHGEIGNGTWIGTGIPVNVTGMDSVFYYSTGYVMAAIKIDRSGWAWGSGISGIPIKVIDTVMFVDAGIYNVAFVKYDGTVWSVGKNAYGEFGDGYAVEAMSSTPKKMNNITKAVRTAQGQFTTCVLLNDGTVWCAGSDQFGGIGDGDSTDVDALEPRKVKDLVGIIDIKAISRINIALDKNGDVWTWGWGYYGLGSSAGGVPNARTPQKITTLKNIIAISGSNDGIHFLALDSSKNCYAWGTNSWGNCGDGTDSIIYSAKIVATDVVEIMAGETFSYIVKSDGTLWAAGKSNINGSIWLNIPDINRKTFTKINPCTDSFKLCCPISLDFIDTFKLPLIDPLDETNVIFFPNAFSPNNDLINDEFKGIISSKYLIENYSLSIFNRWGNLIFSTKDINFGWNGKSGNQDAPIETYFYLAEYNLKNRNKNIQKGDLILIR